MASMLIGQAAVLLFFDIVAQDVAEHDHWHTYEHMPERLAIPGFLRGSRWRTSGASSYMVLYEVSDGAVLTSPAYLARLNNPTRWTQELMKSYRGMSRGLCRVDWTCGSGLGGAATAFRFQPAAGAEASLRSWLTSAALPRLPARPGLAGAALLESAAAAPATREQGIRGGPDAGVDWAVVVSGYDAAALAVLEKEVLNGEEFVRNGAERAPLTAGYSLAYAISRQPPR
jgi:hypothetical protein